MKKVLLFIVLGAGVGMLAAPGIAETAGAIGGYLSHQSEERVDISVGVTRGGDYTQQSRIVGFRDVVVVPQHYGELVTATMSGNDAVLWFRAKDGTVRNVILKDAANRPYRVETNGSRLVADLRRPF